MGFLLFIPGLCTRDDNEKDLIWHTHVMREETSTELEEHTYDSSMDVKTQGLQESMFHLVVHTPRIQLP
jgi:hypothetical protein